MGYLYYCKICKCFHIYNMKKENSTMSSMSIKVHKKFLKILKESKMITNNFIIRNDIETEKEKKLLKELENILIVEVL